MKEEERIGQRRLSKCVEVLDEGKEGGQLLLAIYAFRKKCDQKRLGFTRLCKLTVKPSLPWRFRVTILVSVSFLREAVFKTHMTSSDSESISTSTKPFRTADEIRLVMLARDHVGKLFATKTA